MTNEELQALSQKFLNGTATADEKALLHGWYASNLNDKDELVYTVVDEDAEVIKQRLFNRISERANLPAPNKTVRLWPRIAVAAAAVTAIAFGVWFYIAPKGGRHLDDRRDLLNYAIHDIAPGKNGATITLGNGQVIALSGEKQGVVIGQDLRYTDNTPVVNANPSSRPSGRDPLNSTDKRSPGALEMTAETKKGQMYEFTLPDGTHVWLNADSKISFPSQFSGKERKILLSGEGYFEVAKDKAHPFIVTGGGQEVEVLGTHFNVNTYKDEGAVRTTLLEGRVRVHSLPGQPNDEQGRRVQEKILAPGQQAVFSNYGYQLKRVDVNDVVDWKNGDFIFEQEPLANIMRKVGRWYDVEVSYAADVDQNQTFGGKVSRKRNISQVIKALQATKALKFKIEDKKVYVTN